MEWAYPGDISQSYSPQYAGVFKQTRICQEIKGPLEMWTPQFHHVIVSLLNILYELRVNYER